MSEAMPDPLWYKDAVIYQLHIKSFFDSNNDGVGDFAGLISKLDYIAEIGVTCVWLLPFYPSPRRDDGYDIAEYRDVHPEYGKLADARRFVEEAHKRGLKVITELVINHTSDQHPWFQRARKARPGSSARNFYVWSEDDKKYAGTRIIFLDTEKSNWTWDDEAKAYFWHRFYSHQPDLNFDNPRVLKSIFSVMRFWLDMGVDGLRLDAVPYLVEREGTSNENLPETHAILKRIRAEVDARFEGRMLLAEANQWPEDTQVYFGDGDECHMAFHFPLMPRMYMAIAQEDRFPITDIMRQTPEIPPNCQWAIFLRNHDELTLEMVTDKERDYLWKTYASEPRARLNLGIRRRLAPLLERDRRRIELMNSLLLTMPGTPVIYYGDEIGMGDNLHLGDRDGVRTPMQWSSDRNGGFSRADPASLVLPIIMDPLYGYEAVNVEAQWRDPHSLLNWLRRMLVERRKHKAFGRGTIRFLTPQNRKVLAYLREHDGETILCVANVSRTAQAVELDLSQFAGRAPVELSGDTVFPMVGQLSYLLTLPPYGFYWFSLSTNAAPPAWSSATPGPAVEHHTFVLRQSLAEIVENGARTVLQRDVLPHYIAQRRWFQQKDWKGSEIQIARAGPIDSDGQSFLYTEVTVSSDGRTACYVLPMAIAWEDEVSNPFEAPLALARVRKGARVGLLTDAFASPVLARTILDGLRQQKRIQIGDSEIHFFPTDHFLESQGGLGSESLEWPAAEQTNSTLAVGRKMVIKLLRRLSAGRHPEGEMSRFLTDRGFDGTPPLFGEMLRIGPDGETVTVAIAQGYVFNQGDGWQWTLDRLSRIVDEGATPFPGADKDGIGQYLVFARQAGRRIGQMHRVLAEPSDDPDFAPEPITMTRAGAIGNRILAQIDAALAAAKTSRDSEAAALARELTNRRNALAPAIAAGAAHAAGQIRTRIHGDMHLGQVLIAGEDVQIIDFEGEPSKSLAERRRKALPLRDVAGMLRSFDYAAVQVERQARQAAEESVGRASAILANFRTHASDALLEGYQESIGHALSESDHVLLQLLMLEKAAYEICYEASNRPDWLIVPLRGLLLFAEGLLQREAALA
ncbi:MAG TPA: maltose alpha-D-glucosyltransferase [Rhizomicrobium sp.]|nr:maltose alpha-D-glucosyltransferase [Rhizomicrobium sp.]